MSHLRVILCLTLIAVCAGKSACGQQIAFTWDDLPAHSALPPGETRVGIGKKIIAAMQAEHMPPVYGFVNGARTEDEPLSAPMLQAWRDAGLPLGNHTWSHTNLNQRPLADWEADLLRNEPLLSSYMHGMDWHWVRYPNLAEGETPSKRDEARRFLAQHGYRIAGVTMSFGDYMFNAPYARCVAKHDEGAVAQLEKAYLDAAAAAFDSSRAMAKQLYGHDIPYVLLMHVGAFDARILPRLLALYKQRGTTFVSLEDAEKDSFYQNDLDLTLSAVPDTLEGAMRVRGLAIPMHNQPEIDLNAVCRE